MWPERALNINQPWKAGQWPRKGEEQFSVQKLSQSKVVEKGKGREGTRQERWAEPAGAAPTLMNREQPSPGAVQSGRDGGEENVSLKTIGGSLSKMAQQLRELDVLSEDLSSIPAPAWQLTNICNSNPSGSSPFF